MKSISCAVQKKRDCCILPDRHTALAIFPVDREADMPRDPMPSHLTWKRHKEGALYEVFSLVQRPF